MWDITGLVPLTVIIKFNSSRDEGVEAAIGSTRWEKESFQRFYPTKTLHTHYMVSL